VFGSSPTGRSTLYAQHEVYRDGYSQETISIAVMSAAGKVVMECVIETKANTVLQFIHGLRGDLHVTFEEGTWAAWLYDLLKPHVTEMLVCDHRKNALLKQGSESDKIDARKLAELLRLNHLKPVYHGEHGVRTLKELARSYLTITQGLTRVRNRLKALYRSWAIPPLAARKSTRYATARNGSARSRKPESAGVPNTFTSNSMPCGLCQEVRRELLAEARKHPATRLLRQIPSIGPFRAALLIALMQTPYRFRSKRQLWAYCGLALRAYDSGEYRFVGGQLKRCKKAVTIRGLNKNHNHDLKNIFKGAATRAAAAAGPFQNFYEARIATGMKPPMARLTGGHHFARLEELIRFGKEVRRLAENPFQLQLDEARREWKRRKRFPA